MAAFIARWLLVAVAIAPPVHAETESLAGHGEFSATFQYIRVDGFAGALGDIDLGQVHTQVIGLHLDYHLTDRLVLVAALPYVRERYIGSFDHDPLALDPPRPDEPNIDLGDWNTGFQDFHFGARYKLLDAPLIVEPFIYAGIPSSSYPFFGHAAIGRNRDQLEVGSSFVYRPLFSDAWYGLQLGYVFVEKTMGVSVNHINVNVEAGYFLSPRLSARVFAMHREGDGLRFPLDFPPPAQRTDEMWFQHDRLVKHNFTNAGVGMDWQLDNRYRLSTSAFTMLRANQVHDVEYGLDLTLTLSF